MQATIQQLNVWYSKLDFVNKSSILFENLQPLKVSALNMNK